MLVNAGSSLHFACGIKASARDPCDDMHCLYAERGAGSLVVSQTLREAPRALMPWQFSEAGASRCACRALYV